VYLYRTIYSLPRSHSSVQKHVHLSFLAFQTSCSLQRNVTMALCRRYCGRCLLPLARQPRKRIERQLRDSFGGTERRQEMNNIMRAWAVVQEIWRKADLQHGVEVIWGGYLWREGVYCVWVSLENRPLSGDDHEGIHTHQSLLFMNSLMAKSFWRRDGTLFGGEGHVFAANYGLEAKSKAFGGQGTFLQDPLTSRPPIYIVTLHLQALTTTTACFSLFGSRPW
jgi:hypothetical protein